MQDFDPNRIAQLADKTAALERLIGEADRAAARLEAAIAAAQQVETPAAPSQTAFCPTSQADALKPGVLGSAGISLELPTDPTASQSRDPNPDRRVTEPHAEQPLRRRRHEEVYQLADSGCDAAEVARQLSAPIGEIELILSLRDSR
jgi:hypothetical protein